MYIFTYMHRAISKRSVQGNQYSFSLTIYTKCVQCTTTNIFFNVLACDLEFMLGPFLVYCSSKACSTDQTKPLATSAPFPLQLSIDNIVTCPRSVSSLEFKGKKILAWQKPMGVLPLILMGAGFHSTYPGLLLLPLLGSFSRISTLPHSFPVSLIPVGGLLFKRFFLERTKDILPEWWKGGKRLSLQRTS